MSCMRLGTFIKKTRRVSPIHAAVFVRQRSRIRELTNAAALLHKYGCVILLLNHSYLIKKQQHFPIKVSNIKNIPYICINSERKTFYLM